VLILRGLGKVENGKAKMANGKGARVPTARRVVKDLKELSRDPWFRQTNRVEDRALLEVKGWRTKGGAPFSAVMKDEGEYNAEGTTCQCLFSV
jgi:hypothetical protein